MNFIKKYFYQKIIPSHVRLKIENGSMESLKLAFFLMFMLAAWIFFSFSFLEYHNLFNDSTSLDGPTLFVFLCMQTLFLLNWQALIKCSENLFLVLSTFSLLTIGATQIYLDRYYPLFLFALICLPFVFFILSGWHFLLLLITAVAFYGCNRDFSTFFILYDQSFLWSGFILSVLFLGFTGSWYVKLLFNRLLITTNNKQKRLKHIIRGLVHDLSNPVSVISGSLELLESNIEIRSSQKALDRLQRMKIACDVLEGVLLEAKRDFVASDRSSPSKEESFCDLRECIEASLLILDKKLQDKKINTVANFQSETITIKGEKTLVVSHILTNVLSNSIKFSYPESKIYLSLYSLDQFVALSIKDEGVGIPEQQLSEILSLDKPTSCLGTFGETGSGYGLLLVKYHMDELGGWVSIESKTKNLIPESHGTTVTLYFLKTSQERKRA